MISINCEGCSNSCCQNLHLTPVLLPSEEKRFKKYSRKIKIPYRDISVLAKKENGNCVLLDDRTKRCTIYDKRPLECFLYPFLLDFSKAMVSVKLDRRFCPHLATLTFGKKKLIAFVRSHQFPSDWVKSYNTLGDF